MVSADDKDRQQRQVHPTKDGRTAARPKWQQHQALQAIAAVVAKLLEKIGRIVVEKVTIKAALAAKYAIGGFDHAGAADRLAAATASAAGVDTRVVGTDAIDHGVWRLSSGFMVVGTVILSIPGITGCAAIACRPAPQHVRWLPACASARKIMPHPAGENFTVWKQKLRAKAGVGLAETAARGASGQNSVPGRDSRCICAVALPVAVARRHMRQCNCKYCG